MSNNAITIELISTGLRNIQFPFYLVFRALGWATDREIFDNILYGHAGYPESVGRPEGRFEDLGSDQAVLFKRMYNILQLAMNSSGYDTATYKLGASQAIHQQSEVLEFIVNHLPKELYKDLDFTKEEHVQQAVTKLLKNFDEDLYPHIMRQL